MWVPHVLPRPCILPVHVPFLSVCLRWVIECAASKNQTESSVKRQRSGLTMDPHQCLCLHFLLACIPATLSTTTHTQSPGELVKSWGTEEKRWRKDGESKLCDGWPNRLWISDLTITTHAHTFVFVPNVYPVNCAVEPLYPNTEMLRDYDGMIWCRLVLHIESKYFIYTIHMLPKNRVRNLFAYWL